MPSMPFLPKPILPDAIYRLPVAAQLVDMHPETLRRKIQAGLISAKRRGGGHWRVRGSELLRLA